MIGITLLILVFVVGHLIGFLTWTSTVNSRLREIENKLNVLIAASITESMRPESQLDRIEEKLDSVLNSEDFRT